MAEKIAVLGDSHFPGRARELPEKLLSTLRKFSPNLVVFTGDANSGEALDRIIRACPGAEMKAVRGEKDYLDLPEEEILEIEGVKMGIVHGDFAKPPGNLSELANYARHLKVSVLLCGHSHKLFVGRAGDTLIVNPGSLTGVPFPGGEETEASIVLLTVEFGRVGARSVALSKGRLEETAEEFIVLPKI